jgi:hypothetical protein
MCGSEAPAAAFNCPHCGEELRQTERPRRSEDRFSTGNRIDAGTVLSTAWKRYTQQPGAAIGGLFVNLMANFVIGLLALGGFGISLAMGRTSIGLSVLSFSVVVLGTYAATIWLQLGLTRFFISLARGHAADFSLLFSAGRFILRAVLCGLLIGVILAVAAFGLGVAIVAARTIGGPIAAVIAGLIALILWIRVIMSFLWAFHVLVDTDARDVSAVFLSRDLMAGNYIAVFLILFVAGLIPIAPAALLVFLVVFRSGMLILMALVFAMLIQVFVVIPFVTVMVGVTYDHLSGGGNRRPGDAD